MRPALVLAVAATAAVAGCAGSGADRPPMPDWATVAGACSWQWREGGGLGLWAETCALGTGRWEVAYSDAAGAFESRRDGESLGIVVRSFPLAAGRGIDSLGPVLASAGGPAPGPDCVFAPAALRPAPPTTAFFVLRSTRPDALAMTADGEIPEPPCGPYGASTHGVRYFMTDTRWPGWALFIDEGQERPMFDPRSVTVLP